MTVFLSGCVYAGKFAIQFSASLNLDLAYHRGEPLFPASPRSPRISGQVFSKLASRCSPRSSTPPMRCWASGHVSAAPNEVKASRSRSVGGNETWLTRPFAAAMARRSKEAIRRASASTKPSSSASGSARLTYPYRSAVSPSKSFAPRTISSARPRPTSSGRRSVAPPPGFTPTPTSGWPDRCSDVPHVAGQIKVGKIELRIPALEHNDTQARGGIHSSEQVLEAFEYGGVDNVERRIIEQNPPVGGRFLDDPHVRR